ncbi:MAG: hypothetical protein GXY13_01350 [Acidimicrobiales bacterium]|nr:hypothetical protein [Acidimicrobiales bacterium]
MHTFAVVAARPGRRVPDHVEAALRGATHRDVTFAPTDHLHWRSDDGDVQVAGWSVGAEHLGMRSYWHRTPSGGLAAFAGHPWIDRAPWTTDRGWAEQIADRTSVATIDDVAPRIGGHAAVVVAEADGRAAVTADPLGFHVLYRGRNDDVEVVSNRAAVTARLLARPGVEPPRDVEAAVLLAYASSVQHGRSPFRGVTVVDPATVVHLAPGRDATDRAWSAQPWRSTELDGHDPEALYPVAIDALREALRAQVAVPAWTRTLELTGGRDSRTVLALLLAEELTDDLVCITWGSPALADVQVAGALADRFDLDLRAQGRPRRPRRAGPAATGTGASAAASPAPGAADAAASPEETFEQQVRRHVWRTSGGMSIWDMSRQARHPSPNIVLTGQYGELLRTNYARTTGLGTRGDLERFLRGGGFAFDAAGLLRPEVRRELDRQVIEYLGRIAPDDGPEDAADAFYLTVRVRRWFGSIQELDNRNRLFPLYTLPAIQVAFAIGPRLRRAERLPFEIMRACCPDLATMPFASKPWPAELVAGWPDADRYQVAPPVTPWRPPRPSLRQRARGWLGREPAPRPREVPKLAGEESAMRDIEAKIPVLRRFADLGPDHELYRYLDHDATMQAIDEVADLRYMARKGVHDAVTAAAWLAGAEEPELIDEPG